MIILIGSNKGGSGKTTTAITLASGLCLYGETCLIDADPQCSASRWSTDREENKEKLKYITCFQKTGNLQPTLKNIKNKYKFIIIDVAGRNSRELITGMLCADILISPAQCSQLDLDTLEELKEQVIRGKDLNRNLRVFIYHVMASTNHKVAPNNDKEFKNFIKDFETFSILKSISCYRKIYRDVMVNGQSVLEQNTDEKAKKEAKNLIKEVMSFGN